MFFASVPRGRGSGARPGGMALGGAALALCLIVLPATAVAEAGEELQVLVRPDAVVWGAPPPKLPPGARFAVLLGDPSVPGKLYVFRVKLPDGFSVPPHVHPIDEHVTVIEGTMTLGFGKTQDGSPMQELPAGSYIRLPQGVPHYNRMKGPTVLQFHGIGPFDIIYMNPEDDPSRREPIP